MKDVDAFLFDFDGTLWDPESEIFRAHAEVFLEFGHRLPVEVWSSLVGTIGSELWTRLERATGCTADRRELQERVHRRQRELLGGLCGRPGVHRILGAVDALGISRGIVSNSTREWVARYARQCGMAEGWSTVQCADGDRAGAKPEPDLYVAALAALGIPAERAVAFEDSPSGVRAAKRAGIRCVAIPNAMTAALDLHEADMRFESFEQVDLPGIVGATGGRPMRQTRTAARTAAPKAPSGGEAGSALRHYYYRPDDLRVVGGEGVYLRADDGRRYLDCSSGTFNLSLGYAHPEIVEVVREQAGRLIHVTSKFQTEPLNALVAKLAEVSPPNLTRVHLKSASGSDANESAVKIAQVHTGKSDVVTLFRGHLGQTLGMIGASGAAFRRAPFPSHLPGVVHVPDPHCLRCFYRQERATCGLLCVERINDFIDYASTGRVACVVLEPISGNGGNVVPPDGYLQALKDLCEERGILLVFDEIQTGFGRTGRMFAADHFGVAPHLMTFGKGLGGAGMPIAGILTEERLTGVEGHHINSTFGGNVLAAAAALKTVEIIGRPGFLENVRDVGGHVLERLRDLATRVPFVREVRGVGLMIGIDIVDRDGRPDPGLTNHLAERGLDHGLLLRTSLYGHGNVLKVRPALIMTRQEADEMCDLLERLFLSVVS
ncbi:aminotransferase class III-fold pyridoxal phosphate-dependent enzyme [Kitasatospora sp. NPDC004723]|uniref:aminotransferase class III-fold pyridoxal phosphate-dependent enzyme n=1 Tax=Kitasatospora sp. NPDC004723 TaxID=3154288 RepID=UPI0033AEDD41